MADNTITIESLSAEIELLKVDLSNKAELIDASSGAIDTLQAEVLELKKAFESFKTKTEDLQLAESGIKKDLVDPGEVNIDGVKVVFNQLAFKVQFNGVMQRITAEDAAKDKETLKTLFKQYPSLFKIISQPSKK